MQAFAEIRTQCSHFLHHHQYQNINAHILGDLKYTTICPRCVAICWLSYKQICPTVNSITRYGYSGTLRLSEEYSQFRIIDIYFNLMHINYIKMDKRIKATSESRSFHKIH